VRTDQRMWREPTEHAAQQEPDHRYQRWTKHAAEGRPWDFYNFRHFCALSLLFIKRSSNPDRLSSSRRPTVWVSPRTLYRLIDRGRLLAYRFGRVTRPQRDDVDDYIASCRVAPARSATSIVPSAVARPTAQVPSASTVYRILVRHGLVNARLDAADGRTTSAGNGTPPESAGDGWPRGSPDLAEIRSCAAYRSVRANGRSRWMMSSWGT
jgi:excisionase family DNA binding protein